jgi:hypothetical protein
VDFVRRWSEKTEIGAGRFIQWLDITASKLSPNSNVIFGLHPNKMLRTAASPMLSWRQEQFAA